MRPALADQGENVNATHALRMTVYASVFAALTAAGALLSIPIGPVPIVLQNMFVFLAGLLLGSRWGVASVAVYLLAGLCGLPVFAGGLSGIGRIVGPTGGYLVGYLPAVFVIGAVTGQGPARTSRDVTAMLAGSIILYACGVSWLKLWSGMSWSKSLAVGLYPFIIGDLVKIAAAAALAKALRPILAAARPQPAGPVKAA